MSQFISKKSNIKLKILAWYQIVGGVLGLLVVIWLVAHTAQLNTFSLLILLLAIGLYVFSIYCGRLLLTTKYIFGLKLSLINQIIQVPQFAMLGYAFWYVSGSMLSLGIVVDHGFTFSFHFGLISTFQISIATDETQFVLAINLAAILVVYFIERIKTGLRDDELEYEDSVTAEVKPSAIDEIPQIDQ